MPSLHLDEAQMPQAEIAAFDVPALLLGGDVFWYIAEPPFGRHDRVHGELLDDRTGGWVFRETKRLWRIDLRQSRLQKPPRNHQRRTFQDRRQRRDLAFAFPFGLALVQPLDQPLGGRLGIGGIDALHFAGTLFLPQLCGTGVPIVDLARQARPHLALHLVDLGELAAPHFGQMVGYEAGDRIAKRSILDASRQPRRSNDVGNDRLLFSCDRPVIEVRRRAAIERCAVFKQMDELESLRDHAGLTGPHTPPIPDRMFEIDEEARFHALIGVVDKDAALGKERLEALQHNIDRRFKKGMTGREQFGLRLADDK